MYFFRPVYQALMHPLKAVLTLLDDNFRYLPLNEPQPSCCLQPLRLATYFTSVLLVSFLFSMGNIAQLLVVNALKDQLTHSVLFGLADAFCYITYFDLLLKVHFYLLQGYRHYKGLPYIRPVCQELFDPVRYTYDHSFQCYAGIVFHTVVPVVHSIAFSYLILSNHQSNAYLSLVTVCMFVMVYEQVLCS